MARYYNTFERMLERDEVQVFVRWVQKKEPEFYASMRDSNDRKRKRRR